eukprot:CAMPEP_0177534434 /NCGR_PEP_ID=MMETSP0369-20130122/55946_1 /TAXON_ID=447022 ORGANISM="Scrippsiella hangoei-like, Strain SHHI-4" /NCGR_SAMPLE_ID=MMETSP0369 /ASSEMBLY_ACC=CAM_ASM_000364 /LENGTH=56 /DNA_ID=CAMNT_0019016387 /DNA_START=78 /DNA_END=244 /DNA_ORIENTATION=-
MNCASRHAFFWPHIRLCLDGRSRDSRELSEVSLCDLTIVEGGLTVKQHTSEEQWLA